jgi:hypothetical protein
VDPVEGQERESMRKKQRSAVVHSIERSEQQRRAQAKGALRLASAKQRREEEKKSLQQCVSLYLLC